MPIRRYRENFGVTLDFLNKQLPVGSPATDVTNSEPRRYFDVDAPLASSADLDECMMSIGFEFVEEDPVQTLLAASQLSFSAGAGFASSVHNNDHQLGEVDEIDVTGLSGELADSQKTTVRLGEDADTGSRARLSFTAGSGISIAVADDAVNDEIDVTVTATGGAPGSGDVVGPASATDNAVARYDGTTGKLIQTSGILIDDAGNVSSAGTYNGVTVEGHASRHSDGGGDEIQVQNLASSSSTTTERLRPDGAGGLEFIASDDLTDFDAGTDTTSGGTPLTKVSVTIPAENATWLVVVTALVSHSNSTGNPAVRLQNTTDAATLGRTWESEMDDSANVLSATLRQEFTNTAVAGAKTLALQYFVTSGSGTLTISDAYITARRVIT